MSKINFLLSLKSVPVISWININNDWYIHDINQKAKEFFGTEEEISKLLKKRKIRLALNNVYNGKYDSKKITNVKGHTLKIIKDENSSMIFTLLEKAETDLTKIFNQIDNCSIGISLIKLKKNDKIIIKYTNKILLNLIDDLENELKKGLNSRIINGNKKLNIHGCGDNYYLILIERLKNGIKKETPLEINMYKNIKLELNSIYAVLDLSVNSEYIKDIRESCNEISQIINDYYYSTLIDRDDIILDIIQFNIYDLINNFEWKDIKINYNIIPWLKGDLKKIKYILSSLYTTNSSIKIFYKSNGISNSKVKRITDINLQNIYFKIKEVKQLNPKTLRYKILEYLCSLMNGNINYYGQEIIFNLVLNSNYNDNIIGLISNIFKDLNILVWTDNNWTYINNILDSFNLHAVHVITKKRMKSYIKSTQFDIIIIDKLISKPKCIKNIIYLVDENKSIKTNKNTFKISFKDFNIISCYNILRQIINNNDSYSESSNSSVDSIKIMKTCILIDDMKTKSLFSKQITSLKQIVVDKPEEADIIIIEITKGINNIIHQQNLINKRNKILIGINFGPQLSNRQKHRIYKFNVKLILNSPISTNDFYLMYKALSSS